MSTLCTKKHQLILKTLGYSVFFCFCRSTPPKKKTWHEVESIHRFTWQVNLTEIRGAWRYAIEACHSRISFDSLGDIKIHHLARTYCDYYGWLVVDQPPEKYESQIGSSSQLLGKIKNVWNHQPVLAFLPLSYYKFHPYEIWLPASEQTFADTPLESPWLLLYITTWKSYKIMLTSRSALFLWLVYIT